MAAFIRPTQTLTLALDGDLAGDCGGGGLNDDDLVLQIAPSEEDPGCSGPVQVSVAHPPGRSLAVPATAAWVQPYCVLHEYAYDSLLYGVQYAARREYYPRAGKAIGFAAARGSREAPVELTDPTAWWTLVLTADR